MPETVWRSGKNLSLMAAIAIAIPAMLSTTYGAEPPKPGNSIRDCANCPEMIVVPAGSFTMGSATEAMAGPQRRVTIARHFAVGKYEVTFAEWDACMADRGCTYKPEVRWNRDGGQPVVNVSWDNALQYVAWLSRKTGKRYRLLTEAEWEYAARAGATTNYSWGDDIGSGNAHCNGCGSNFDMKQPAPVGSFKPNAFGLHDMHGNVWEWVQDCWEHGFEGAPRDGSARTKGCDDDRERVQRGGAFLHEPKDLFATVRNNYTQTARANGVGFRLARDL